jgi:hypothetical protein
MKAEGLQAMPWRGYSQQAETEGLHLGPSTRSFELKSSAVEEKTI